MAAPVLLRNGFWGRDPPSGVPALWHGFRKLCFTLSVFQAIPGRLWSKDPAWNCQAPTVEILFFLSWKMISRTEPWAINPGNSLVKRRRPENAHRHDNNLCNGADKLCKPLSLSFLLPRDCTEMLDSFFAMLWHTQRVPTASKEMPHPLFVTRDYSLVF